jgi:translation initiation factor 4G
LGRCQLDFESGWKAREEAATAAAAKSAEDKAQLAKQETDKEGGGEAAMLSDEYYTAQKAKRRGLGLVQLIGELYKLDMLGKGVIKTCFIKLLGNIEDPDEEDIESTIKLLTTVGRSYELASPENMEAVFDRLNTVRQGSATTSRIKFMIMVSSSIWLC